MPDAYRIARIRTMIEDGSSSSVIAAEMGTTRSAICGFCHRKGISLTGLQGVQKAAPRRPAQKARVRSIPAPAPLPEDEGPAGGLAEPAQAHIVEAAPEVCIPLTEAP
ncbi:MAG: GcrA family cell cycle regulator, partial [Pannonibacter phragmitetus]